MLVLSLLHAVLLQSIFHHAESVCEDFDSSACEMMELHDSSLCHNSALALSACPKYCNLCGITCYDCAHNSVNGTDCTNTKKCAVGESCFIAKFHDATDGHYEYKMNCATFEHCQGNQFLALLGRRGLDTRTISTECCQQDLCNNPAYSTPATTVTVTTRPATPPTTTPPECNKDISFMIQDSEHQSGADVGKLKTFLKAVSSSLSLGSDKSYVGVAAFDRDIHSKTALQSSQTELNHLITDMRFDRHSSDVNIDHVFVHGYFHEADPHAHEIDPNHPHPPGPVADRPQFDNVLVIMFDTSGHMHLDPHFPPDLPPSYISTVIVVNVGGGTLDSKLTHLATGSQHILAVDDYVSLPSIEAALLSLICA